MNVTLLALLGIGVQPWTLCHMSTVTCNPSHYPLRDIPSGCCFFAGPWTVTRSSLRMLRRVAAFCWPLRPVLLLVSFPRSRSPMVDVLGLCWMWHGVPFARQRRPVVGVLGLCWLLRGSFDCFCSPYTSVLRLSTTCLAAFPPLIYIGPYIGGQVCYIWVLPETVLPCGSWQSKKAQRRCKMYCSFFASCFRPHNNLWWTHTVF